MFLHNLATIQRIGVFSLLLFCGGQAYGQNSETKLVQPRTPAPSNRPKEEPPFPEELQIKPLEEMPLKETGPGMYELGKVKLDQGKRSVSFPASINMHEGPIEYLLVTGYGKTHESVLVMSVKPYHIHLCALLLGTKGANYDALGKRFKQLSPGETVPADELNEMLKNGLYGQNVEIIVRWEYDGKAFEYKAEELLTNIEKNKTMPAGGWYYTGSRVENNMFLASQHGDGISIIGDFVSMINYIGPDFKNDEIWEANVKLLPPVDHPIDITVIFPISSTSEPKK